MTFEYEEVRARYEAEALAARMMTREQLDSYRDWATRLLCGLGLTRERVWELTSGIRRTCV